MKRALLLITLAIGMMACQSPAIVTQQKALCTHSDSRVARFEYRRTEHLNPIVTSYSAQAGQYEVGRVYIVKIISK